MSEKMDYAASTSIQTATMVKDAFEAGFDAGQRAVMYIIDGILFVAENDAETVAKIEKYANEFWRVDTK